MHERTRLVLTAFTLAGLLQQIVACNAALGIEEAELDETLQGGSCEFPWAEPQQECVASSDCEACMGACDPNQALSRACLDDPECRLALQNHRWCLNLDAGCSDEDDACLNCLPSSGPGQGVQACMGQCNEVCDGTGAYTLCDLYCSCMAAQCPSRTFPMLDGSETTDCAAFCQAAQPWQTSCRLSHCTLAVNPPDPGLTTDHCRHAVSLDDMCLTQQPQQSHCSGEDDPSKALNGHGCDTNADCCSGHCVAGSCHAVGLP